MIQMSLFYPLEQTKLEDALSWPFSLLADVVSQDPEYGDPPRCHMGKHIGFISSVVQCVWGDHRESQRGRGRPQHDCCRNTDWSPGGLRGTAQGGLVGLTLSGLYAFYNNWDHLKGSSPTRY